MGFLNIFTFTWINFPELPGSHLFFFQWIKYLSNKIVAIISGIGIFRNFAILILKNLFNSLYCIIKLINFFPKRIVEFFIWLSKLIDLSIINIPQHNNLLENRRNSQHCPKSPCDRSRDSTNMQKAVFKLFLHNLIGFDAAKSIAILSFNL